MKKDKDYLIADIVLLVVLSFVALSPITLLFIKITTAVKQAI